MPVRLIIIFLDRNPIWFTSVRRPRTREAYLADDGPLAAGGTLADVAPTLLAIQGLEVPREMAGEGPQDVVNR